MNKGQIYRSTSLTTVIAGATVGLLRETWTARKGNRFVYLMLGFDEPGKTLDARKALNEMGWVEWEKAIEAAVKSLHKARRLPKHRRDQYDGADLRADMVKILKGE